MSNVLGPEFDTSVLKAARGPEGALQDATGLRQAAVGQENFLGEVVSKEEGKIWTFANACVVYNPQTERAYVIEGDIYRKWLSLGGLNYAIPCTNERSTPDGVGRYSHFNDNTCSIYWSPTTGSWSIMGDIRKKWASLGWEQSPLGYPVTDELPTVDGVGRFNHFAKASSIYWTPETGANMIDGEIRNKWESLGWEGSYLGYPTSDTVDFPDGGRANEFQHGGIYWWGDTGAIDLKDMVVHYTGLHCEVATDGSGSDEPYAILGVSTPHMANTLRTPVYKDEDVDDGISVPALIEIYRGRPYGISIATVLMEHDEGDPDKYKEEITLAVKVHHEAGKIALGEIPIVGQLAAAAAEYFLDDLMPDISEAINDLFGAGDDRIGASTVTLSPKEMVVLATRTANTTFNNIGFKAQTDWISGLGGSYKLYFGLVPA